MRASKRSFFRANLGPLPTATPLRGLASHSREMSASAAAAAASGFAWTNSCTRRCANALAQSPAPITMWCWCGDLDTRRDRCCPQSNTAAPRLDLDRALRPSPRKNPSSSACRSAAPNHFDGLPAYLTACKWSNSFFTSTPATALRRPSAPSKPHAARRSAHTSISLSPCTHTCPAASCPLHFQRALPAEPLWPCACGPRIGRAREMPCLQSGAIA